MAKTDTRLFAPFPIEMDEHPKIAPLSDSAFRALFEATFYSRRMLSDGFLDERIVLKRWGQVVADELSGNDRERPSWVRVEGGWQIHDFAKHHPVRADIEALQETRKRAGKVGGLRSAESRVGKQNASKVEANGKQEASQSNPETETETETSTKNTVQDKPARSVDSEFAEWWQVYPRKQAKPDALRAFKAARKTTSLDDLIKGAREYALLNAGGDKSKVKMPAGWLRSERWDDEDKFAAEGLVPPWQQQQDRPILHHMASSPECDRHRGYPMPCAGCARDLDEGREF